MVAGDSKLKPPDPILSRSTSVIKYTPNLHPVLEELGNPEARIARHVKEVRFSRALVELIGPHELNYFNNEDNAVASLLNYMRDHGVPIHMPRVMNSVELKNPLNYEEYSSAVK